MQVQQGLHPRSSHSELPYASALPSPSSSFQASLLQMLKNPPEESFSLIKKKSKRSLKARTSIFSAFASSPPPVRLEPHARSCVHTPTPAYFRRQKSSACYLCKFNCKEDNNVDRKLKEAHKCFWKSFHGMSSLGSSIRRPPGPARDPLKHLRQ